MKKRWIAATLVAATLLLCTGCSGTRYDFDLSKYITLGEYKGIEIEASKLQEAYDEQLKTILESHKEEKEITDRAVEDGDTVNIDYVGKIDDVAFEGGSAEKADLTIGSKKFIDGFETGLIGHNKDEEVTLNLKFPDSYPNNPDLAGKDVVFTVKINSITASVTPELDQAFLDANYKDQYASVEEFSQKLRTSIKKTQVWKAVMSNATYINYPKKYVKEYYDNIIDTYKAVASQTGLPLATYLAYFQGISEETFLQNSASSAVSEVRDELLACAIANAENFVLDDAYYQEHVMEIAEQSSYSSVEELEKNMKRPYIELYLKVNYAMDFVLENAVEK